MKTIHALWALAALAACSQNEPAPQPEPTASAAAAQDPSAPWQLEAGTYQYTRSDGVKGTNTLAPDGTFSNEMENGEVETGTWGQENGLSCLVPSQGDKRCYTFTHPDATGNFTGTMPDGVTAIVHKVS